MERREFNPFYATALTVLITAVQIFIVVNRAFSLPPLITIDEPDNQRYILGSIPEDYVFKHVNLFTKTL